MKKREGEGRQGQGPAVSICASVLVVMQNGKVSVKRQALKESTPPGRTDFKNYFYGSRATRKGTATQLPLHTPCQEQATKHDSIWNKLFPNYRSSRRRRFSPK